MVNLRVLSSVTLFIISNVKAVEPLMQESFYKLLGSLTSVKHVRIPELLNQLCNESQGPDTVLQDACYGCFFRATNQPLGYPSLASMSNCADLYLNNTDYGHCQRYLNNATSTPATKANPSTIYCTFLECIRQVNKDTLEALRVRPRMAASSGKTSRKAFFLYLKLYKQLARGVCIIKEQDSESNTIRECVGEAIRMTPGFNLTDVKLAQLFVNTTACVLAKTRCALMNPITGEFQDDGLANKLHIPTINAVLVNTDYNINIVQLPFHYGPVDVCAKYRNFEQATWPSVTC